MRCQIKLTCCKTALARSNTWGRSTGSIPLAKPTTDFVLLHVLPLPFVQANSRKMPREMTHGSTRTTLTSHGSYEDKLTSPWPNCLIRLKKNLCKPSLLHQSPHLCLPRLSSLKDNSWFYSFKTFSTLKQKHRSSLFFFPPPFTSLLSCLPHFISYAVIIILKVRSESLLLALLHSLTLSAL